MKSTYIKRLLTIFFVIFSVISYGQKKITLQTIGGGDTAYVKTTGIQNVYGKKTFLDTTKGIDLSNTDSTKNIAPTQWIKRQLYAQRDAIGSPGGVPFYNSSGVLTQDPTGLYYTGTIFNIGTNSASIPSGIQLNGGRGTITADINGMQFRSGGATGSAYDATKHFKFFNGTITTPYLDIYSTGTGPYTHQADFTADVSTTLTMKATQFKTTSTVFWSSGTGSPQSVVTAGIGSLYTRTDGGAGTTLYVKESGTGNTGWIAK